MRRSLIPVPILASLLTLAGCDLALPGSPDRPAAATPIDDCAAQGADSCPFAHGCQAVYADAALAGCRPVSSPPRSCAALDSSSCLGVAACVWVAGSHPASSQLVTGDGGLPERQVPVTAHCQPRPCLGLGEPGCRARADCGWSSDACTPAPPPDCDALVEDECLSRDDCQPVGSAGYCPAGASCALGGGEFDHCQAIPNAHGCRGQGRNDSCGPGYVCGLTCAPPADCELAGQTCQPDCQPTCRPQAGCDALDEQACQAMASCQPKYEERCVDAQGVTAPIYYAGTGGPNCIPTPTFTGCAALPPGQIVPERSLLILDPDLLADPAYSFRAIMTSLGGGDPAPLLAGMFQSMLEDRVIGTRTARARSHVGEWLRDHDLVPGDVDRLRFRPVAIVNRPDLVSNLGCGEARIVFATDFGVVPGDGRMTVIAEFAVPDDGHGCASIAARWAALSQWGAGDPRYREALHALTDELFQPERLSQLRTDELLGGPRGRSDWELREYSVVGGLPEPRPCRESPDPAPAAVPDFEAWAHANQAALEAGPVEVPARFLAASSITDAARVSVRGLSQAAGDHLDQATCKGCHSTDFNARFVHISEPPFAGTRARISPFLELQLGKRAAVLGQLLSQGAAARALRTRAREALGH